MANRNRIVNYLRNNYCDNILEIGVLNGDMALAMLRNSTNKNVRYVGVDLFEDVNDNILRNEYLSKKPESVGRVYRRIKSETTNFILHKGYSNLILQKFVNTDEKFDLIFIDGGKSLETIRTDFRLCIQLLSERGIIFLDADYENVRIFMDNELEEYDIEKDVVEGIAEIKYKTVRNNINVLTCFDKRHLNIFYDIFLTSLSFKADLYGKYFNEPIVINEQFNIEKIKYINDFIKNEDNAKNLVLYCDVDTIFLNKELIRLLNSIYVREEEPDILLQVSHKNIPLILIKPSENVKHFLNEIIDIRIDILIEKHNGINNYIKELIKEKYKDLKLRYLPSQFHTGTNSYLPNGLITYSATMEDEIYNKYEKLNYFKNIYN